MVSRRLQPEPSTESVSASGSKLFARCVRPTSRDGLFVARGTCEIPDGPHVDSAQASRYSRSPEDATLRSFSGGRARNSRHVVNRSARPDPAFRTSRTQQDATSCIAFELQSVTLPGTLHPRAASLTYPIHFMVAVRLQTSYDLAYGRLGTPGSSRKGHRPEPSGDAGLIDEQSHAAHGQSHEAHGQSHAVHGQSHGANHGMSDEAIEAPCQHGANGSGVQEQSWPLRHSSPHASATSPRPTGTQRSKEQPLLEDWMENMRFYREWRHREAAGLTWTSEPSRLPTSAHTPGGVNAPPSKCAPLTFLRTLLRRDQAA